MTRTSRSRMPYLSSFGTMLLAGFLATSGAGAVAPPSPVDLFGDPLPAGAAARLGTVRLCYAACMAFSADGKIVATAQRHVVHLWDAATGKQLRRFTTPRSMEWAHTVAIAPDGRKVAVLGNFGLDVVVWQVDKETPLFTAHIDREGPVHQMVMARIVFSADSKTLYTGNDRTVHAWDAATGKESHRFQHNADTNILVFSREGKRFATAGDREGLAHLWDAHAGKSLHVLDGHRQRIRCAGFSPDGSLLATGDHEGTLRLWDVKNGKQVRKLGGLKGEVVAVAFAADGKTMATANRDHFSAEKQFIRLWDLNDKGTRLRKTLTALGVTALEYSPDGKTLAWICCERSVRLLDATTGEERMPLDIHHGDVNAVAYAPDGRSIATASADHTIRLWDADTGKPKGVLRGHTDEVNALAFSPDGKWLASASSDHTAALWDMEMRTRRFECKGHGNKVHAVAFAPDGKTLVIGGYNWIIQSWDVGTGKELRTIDEDGKEYRDVSNGLAFSPDGRLLAAGGDKLVRLYDARNGGLLRTVKTESMVSALVFSPDGRTLACGCNRWTILWELASGKERARLPGHWNRRGALAYSSDGKLLASGSHDMGGDMNKVVHVWELATGKELGAFRGHEQAVFGVAFSPDGKRLATASGDATTLIWDLATVAERGPHPAVDKRSLKSPLDAKDLEVAWSDLASEDAVKAQQAVWMLAREPRQAAAFLCQRLRPASEPKTAHIASLIADLDSERFSTREQATAELTRLGALAEPLLRKKRAEKITLEMRQRLDILLETIPSWAPAAIEELRLLRAVEALEQIGTREARQILRRLAEGSECARQTREVKASLQRRARHPPPSP